jgi:L-alanine-DL-glutamate epimerase-like enolase superfamily enzyme
MQIKRIVTYPVSYPEPNDFNNIRHLLLACVESDDGAVGWGEAITMWPEASLAAQTVIEQGLAPILIGRDPCDNAALWQAMKEQTWWYGNGGIASFAISALDMALWDLKGKALGLPLHQLLGGKLRDRLRACASTHPAQETVDGMVQELAGYARQGYTAVKVGFGKKGHARLGEDPRRDVAFVAAARDALGDQVDFMVDIGYHVRYQVTQAIQVTRAFEQYHIRWIEDPLPAQDWEGYLRLRAAIRTPIATGEREWTPNAYRRLIQQGIGDILLVDPGRVEGVTGFYQVVKMLDAANRHINAHSWSSALNTAASIHLIAVAQNYIVMELKPVPSPMQHELVYEPIAAQDGWIAVPDRPGLGVEVDEAVVRKYAL